MNAVDYYKSGYSCSESIVKEAIDLGLCDESLLPVATSLLAALPCISVVERTAIEWLIGPISTLAHENSKIKDKVRNNSFFIYNSFIDKCM